MIKYLVALIWPIGLAIIAAAAFLASRRYASPPAAAGRAARAQRPQPQGAGQPAPALTDSYWESARLGAFAVGGHGRRLRPDVGARPDRRLSRPGRSTSRSSRWMIHHQVHVLAALMKRLTKIGNTWTCWGAAFAAAGLPGRDLADQEVAAADRAFAGLIVIDHFTTLALRHVFHRLGPPTSPLGTYPSGGCDRVIVFYGLIAYLLWREFSGQRRTAIWLGAAVAALGFNEAYSRVYLSLHWFTDAVSGLLYGTLLLAVFIIAVQFVAGRPV